jgi:HK97 family phage prohead protease
MTSEADALQQITWGRDHITRTYEDAIRTWDAGRHPRAPAGATGGGEFAPASSGSGAKSGIKAKATKGAKDTRAVPSDAHPVGMGETGKRVSDLQSRLNALGAKPPLKLDGIFGPKTLAAVRAFQKARGLKVDGLVGPKTTAALRLKAPAHKAVHPAAKARGHAPAKTHPVKPAARPAQGPAHRASSDSGIPGVFPHQLANWWEHGEGAAKIRWGQGGDFDRCVRLAVDEAHMDPERAKGFCAERHYDVLGIYPATHAAMDKKATRSGPVSMNGGCDEDGLDGSWDGDLSGLPDLAGLGISDFEAIDSGPGRAMRAASLGSGARFKALTAQLTAKGASDPGALAAWIGRKKYGKGKFVELAGMARKQKGGSRMDTWRPEYMRIYGLEDMHILRSGDGGDGRTVEAFAAVFDQPAEIQDFEGHYQEVIDPAAFNRAIDHVERQRGGLANVKVLYNHGMTIQGTPSERFSVPIGVPVMIRAEARGLLTRTRYSETPLADEILESVRAGTISAQSFTGRIVRSNPQLRRGQSHRARGGDLPVVRRMELGLREYGPVLWPAYSGAEILGVRMSTPGSWSPEPDENEDTALPPDGELAAGGPPAPDGDEHPARHHQHALYAHRSREQRERAGLVW